MVIYNLLSLMHVLFGQEDKRKKEEKDERKRKYNVRWNDEVYLYYYSTVDNSLHVKSWLWLISFPLCLLHHLMFFL